MQLIYIFENVENFYCGFLILTAQCTEWNIVTIQ